MTTKKLTLGNGLELANPLFYPDQVQRNSRAPELGGVYVYTDDLILAVNLALAARRPLLLRGAPGGGKSTLATNVAQTLGWRFLERVVTSGTTRDDLIWRYNHLRRLQHASSVGEKLLDDHEYVEPQALWWALSPETARQRSKLRKSAFPAAPPEGAQGGGSAVVLLDEIDKADPSLPNDLLVVLGAGCFTVNETGETIEADPANRVLVVITTNEERELPPAFLRRCVIAELPRRQGAELVNWLVSVGTAQVGPEHKELAGALAQHVVDPGAELAQRDPPSTAEYLDALHACIRYKVRPDSKGFVQLSGLALFKWKTAMLTPR